MTSIFPFISIFPSNGKKWPASVFTCSQILRWNWKSNFLKLNLSRSVFVCCRSERLRMWLSKLYMRVFFYLSGEQDATQIRQLIKQHEDK